MAVGKGWPKGDVDAALGGVVPNKDGLGWPKAEAAEDLPKVKEGAAVWPKAEGVLLANWPNPVKVDVAGTAGAALNGESCLVEEGWPKRESVPGEGTGTWPKAEGVLLAVCPKPAKDDVAVTGAPPNGGPCLAEGAWPKREGPAGEGATARPKAGGVLLTGSASSSSPTPSSSLSSSPSSSASSSDDAAPSVGCSAFAPDGDVGGVKVEGAEAGAGAGVPKRLGLAVGDGWPKGDFEGAAGVVVPKNEGGALETTLRAAGVGPNEKGDALLEAALGLTESRETAVDAVGVGPNEKDDVFVEAVPAFAGS